MTPPMPPEIEPDSQTEPPAEEVTEKPAVASSESIPAPSIVYPCALSRFRMFTTGDPLIVTVHGAVIVGAKFATAPRPLGTAA